MPIDLMPLHVIDPTAAPPRHRRSDALRVATPLGDPYRQLRGEPPIDDATHEDACRWVEVYTEMVRVWDRTATQFELWVAEVSSRGARQQLGDVDLTLMAARCERLRRRLHLWEQRVRELATVAGNDDDVRPPPVRGHRPAPSAAPPANIAARSAASVRGATAH